MKRQTNRTFFAKILLFGEYSVIFNSMGLTIPYTYFSGSLNLPDEKKYTNLDFALKSNSDLRDYAAYLKQLFYEQSETIIDFDRLENDLDNGLYFESTIPQGYGLGSSGALVAAIYDNYALNPIEAKRNIDKEKLSKLKTCFAQMESYFHGTSSGLDPLNSYMQYPLLIENKNTIKTVNIPQNLDDKFAIFLINTGSTGKTEPLVKLFMNWSEQETFYKLLTEKLIHYNNQSIQALISGHFNQFFHSLKELSNFEYHHFRPMIPNGFRAVWYEGMENDAFQLKLCGSGGGGFLLGFTKNYQKAKRLLETFQIDPITVYKKRKSMIFNNHPV
jgi:mevalonate kinase